MNRSRSEVVVPNKIIAVRDFCITPLDAPIGVFLPHDRQGWVVVDMSNVDLPDQEGSEVYRFGHWSWPNIYVRIEEPPRRAPRL